jgi:DNA-binding transcriptional LysR family regulator
MQLEKVDLDTALLRAFVAAAEEQHFGRAAERLFISQQALSKRIARLESLLGAVMFDRTGREVSLSDAGSRLLPLARGIVDDVDAAVQRIRPSSSAVRVDVLDEHLALLRFVREVADADPASAVEVLMREHHRDAATALRSGDVDVAFGRAGAMLDPWPGSVPADIEFRTALLEPISLLVSAEHPWSDRSGVGLAELKTQRLWFPMTGAPREWRALLDEMRADFSLTIDYGGSTMGFERFVSKGIESRATFYGLAMPAPPIPQARIVPITDPVPVFAWSMMWRRRLPVGARAVADEIVDRARAFTPEPHPDESWMPALDRRFLTYPY